jgi:hypothetical protein
VCGWVRGAGSGGHQQLVSAHDIERKLQRAHKPTRSETHARAATHVRTRARASFHADASTVCATVC